VRGCPHSVRGGLGARDEFRVTRSGPGGRLCRDVPQPTQRTPAESGGAHQFASQSCLSAHMHSPLFGHAGVIVCVSNGTMLLSNLRRREFLVLRSSESSEAAAAQIALQQQFGRDLKSHFDRGFPRHVQRADGGTRCSSSRLFVACDARGFQGRPPARTGPALDPGTAPRAAWARNSGRKGPLAVAPGRLVIFRLVSLAKCPSGACSGQRLPPSKCLSNQEAGPSARFPLAFVSVCSD